MRSLISLVAGASPTVAVPASVVGSAFLLLLPHAARNRRMLPPLHHEWEELRQGVGR